MIKTRKYVIGKIIKYFGSFNGHTSDPRVPDLIVSVNH